MSEEFQYDTSSDEESLYASSREISEASPPLAISPNLWKTLQSYDFRILSPSEIASLAFYSALWSVESFLEFMSKRNNDRRVRERALIRYGTRSTQVGDRSETRPVPRLFTTTVPIFVSISSYAAGRLLVSWSCHCPHDNTCFDVEASSDSAPFQSIRVNGRKREVVLDLFPCAVVCVITVKRLEHVMTDTDKSPILLSAQNAVDWMVVQETSLKVVTPATLRLNWLPPSAP